MMNKLGLHINCMQRRCDAIVIIIDGNTVIANPRDRGFYFEELVPVIGGACPSTFCSASQQAGCRGRGGCQSPSLETEFLLPLEELSLFL